MSRRWAWVSPPRGRRLLNGSVVIGLALLGVLLLLGYFAPLTHDPLATNAAGALKPPSSTHWFGTDRVGADVFSRTIRAARLDLTLALLGTAAALIFGVPFGLIASTKGPWGERIMRALDTFQAFPLVVLALAVVSLSGNRIEMIPFAIALINIPRYMRLIRSEVLSLREKRFVVAAFASGAKTSRILRRHLLPNLRGIILAQTSLAAAHALVVIAALSFLGVGLQPPTPSWGAMIRSGSQHVTSGEWWVFTFPGLAVVIAVISFNRIADGLMDMDTDR